MLFFMKFLACVTFASKYCFDCSELKKKKKRAKSCQGKRVGLLWGLEPHRAFVTSRGLRKHVVQELQVNGCCIVQDVFAFRSRFLLICSVECLKSFYVWINCPAVTLCCTGFTCFLYNI